MNNPCQVVGTSLKRKASQLLDNFDEDFEDTEELNKSSSDLNSTGNVLNFKYCKSIINNKH